MALPVAHAQWTLVAGGDRDVEGATGRQARLVGRGARVRRRSDRERRAGRRTAGGAHRAIVRDGRRRERDRRRALPQVDRLTDVPGAGDPGRRGVDGGGHGHEPDDAFVEVRQRDVQHCPVREIKAAADVDIPGNRVIHPPRVPVDVNIRPRQYLVGRNDR